MTFICWDLYPSNTTSSVSKEVDEEMVVFWPVANLRPPPPCPFVTPFNLPLSKRGVNRPMERRILSELLTDLEILQLQWITDLSIFFFGGGGGEGVGLGMS